MNLRVPYSWLQEYLSKKIPAEKAAEFLTIHSASVERIYRAGEALSVSEGVFKVPSDELVFEIETTTNRPDLLSVVGLARELATLTGSRLRLPRQVSSKFLRGKLKVRIEAKKLCRRYIGFRLEGVRVVASPSWLQNRLRLAGIRPINNVVDVTNYVMLEMGQPLHAFDAEKVGDKIVVRTARRGESIQALDGYEYKLTSNMLVIADKKNPIAIAGIMGGEASGVTDQTTSIILESANFDPLFVRRTSRALNLRSESSARFERSLSSEGTLPAARRAVQLICELTGGRVESRPVDVQIGSYHPPKVILTQSRLDTYLGTHTSLAATLHSLRSLGFISTKKTKERATFLVPYWRDHDITLEEDLIEEITRLQGYERIQSQPLPGHYPQKEDSRLVLERQAREVLVGAGFFETISSALVSEKILEKCNCPLASLKLSNPLSEELAVLTPTLIPLVLETVAKNEREHGVGRIFELQRVYRPQGSNDLPKEPLRLVIAIWGKSQIGELYRQAKGVLELLAIRLGITLSYQPGTKLALAHPGRYSAIITSQKPVGHLAEVRLEIKEKFGIKSDVALVSLNFDKLIRLAKLVPTYIPPPRFPPVKRDLALLVDESVSYSDIVASIKTSALVTHIELFDVYRGKGLPAGKKSLALHLTFSDPNRTLTADEVERELQRILMQLQKQFSLQVR